MEAILILCLICTTLALFAWVLHLLKRKPAPLPEVASSIEQLRSIGHLSTFKVLTKEVVTESDHSWGEFGEKYLQAIMSSRKMAMIFEFEIDFRYDLRQAEFEIVDQGENRFLVRLPPCQHEAHIRDIRFYDEQRSKVLPWLLPDLLNSVLTGGFSEEDKNRLVAAAKAHAEQQALKLIDSLKSEVQASARSTLESIGHAFGASSISFDFGTSDSVHLKVGCDSRVAA